MAYDHYLKYYFKEAVNAYKKKDFIVARVKFEEILAIYPDHAASREYIRKIAYDIERFDVYNAKRVSHYLNIAKRALEKGDPVKARQQYKLALELDPSNYLAKNGLEQTEKHTGAFLGNIRRQKNRGSIEHLYKRAGNFYKKGNFTRAKESLGFILEIDPNNEPANIAMEKVNKYLALLSSDKINAIYKKGVKLFEKGKYEDSIPYFESVLIAAPQRKDVYALMEQARQHIKNIKNDNKAEDLQNNGRNEFETYFNKAVDLYNNEQFEEALKYFKLSRNIAKEYDLEEYSQDSSHYIEKISKDLSSVHYEKAFELSRKNRLEEAAREYTISLNYNPDNTFAQLEFQKIADAVAQKYYEDAMVFYNKSDYIKAGELFRLSLKYDPNKTESRRMLERIQ
jgi:tetratricopeptide (TPR) repeat protein